MQGTRVYLDDRVAGYHEMVDGIDALDQVWEGPTVQAVRAAEEEAIVLCRAAQERFDDIAAGGDEAFGGPWIPAELQEVVRVALGCP